MGRKTMHVAVHETSVFRMFLGMVQEMLQAQVFEDLRQSWKRLDRVSLERPSSPASPAPIDSYFSGILIFAYFSF